MIFAPDMIKSQSDSIGFGYLAQKNTTKYRIINKQLIFCVFLEPGEKAIEKRREIIKAPLTAPFKVEFILKEYLLKAA